MGVTGVANEDDDGSSSSSSSTSATSAVAEAATADWDSEDKADVAVDDGNPLNLIRKYFLVWIVLIIIGDGDGDTANHTWTDQ